MPGDPNSRRDKALEDIARELRETNKHLKQIAENGKRFKFTNTPERPDPFDQPQQPQPGETRKFPDPVHPYLKRSDPDETGPYGLNPPRPYS